MSVGDISKVESIKNTLRRVHPGPSPGNDPFHRSHVVKKLLPHLHRRSSEEKKLVHQIPKSENLSVKNILR